LRVYTPAEYLLVMTKRNFEKTRHGAEAADGSDLAPSTPRERRGPDLYPALMAARNRVTDAGVKFAMAAAEAGVSVAYASDWSPGQKAEEALEAAGVEVVICRPRRGR
jgi:hypothetical protein